MRTPRTPPKPQPPKVYCSDCARCTRDTSGPSFSIITGEYFMGTCPLGHADGRVFHAPDGSTLGKVFMDKARSCEDYKKTPRIL